MFTAMKRMYLMAVAAALSCACSVKEERSECPCLLNLVFDEVIDSGRFDEAVATVGPSPEVLIGQELVEMEECRESGYEVSVPRRTMMTSVVCGCGEDLFNAVSVRAGTSGVMAFSGEVECRDDRVDVLVDLHKQYCCLTLVLEGYRSADELPFEIRMSAPTDGIGLYDLKPCGGPFSATVSGYLTVNVPRQDPGAVITLGLYDGDGNLIFESDISEKLRKVGYDWTDTDLADAVVVLDYARLECDIEILPWDDNGQYRQIDI